MAETNPDVRSEPADVNFPGVLAGVGVVLGGIAVALASAWFVTVDTGVDRGAPGNGRPPAIAGPQLQSAAHTELQAFLEEKNRRLEGYGWVDRRAGRVHIPIEAAMRLLAGQKPPAAGGKGGR